LLHFTASGVSPTLNYVDLTVITNTECANIYGTIVTATKICCSTPGGKSTCNVSFSFRYSSEINFLLSTAQNLLPPPRPPLQKPVFTFLYELCKVYNYPLKLMNLTKICLKYDAIFFSRTFYLNFLTSM